MGGGDSPRDVLLAVALGSHRKGRERRVLPDRRSGIDRRKARVDVPYERRSGTERRQLERRKIDRDEGPTLLQKARTRLSGRLRQKPEAEDRGDGLR